MKNLYDHEPVLLTRTRIPNPTLRENPPLELLQQLKEDGKDDRPTLDESQVRYYRQTGNLAEFYVDVLQPWRTRQRQRGEVANGSLTNERQAIRCWDEFDRLTRPEKWPDSVAWGGCPVGFIPPQRIKDWLTYRLRFGSRYQNSLSPGSLPKRWNHLRFILNQACRLRILDEVPSISVNTVIDAVADEELDELDLIPFSFTEQQLDDVYQQLDGDFELQTAWVLGAFAGPRTGDLFALRWQRNVRLESETPEIVFMAQKTKRKRRRIWVPLGSIVIEHLQRLAKQQAHLDEPQGLVFPRLTDGHRANPEDGERARARTRRLKRALLDAGIPLNPDTEKPWQALRSTANTRLNECAPEAGNRATHGKAASVQGQFYSDYRDLLAGAVKELDERRRAAGMFRKRW